MFAFFGPKPMHFQMVCDKPKTANLKVHSEPCKVFLKDVIRFACYGENFQREKKLNQERIGRLPWQSLLGRVVSRFASFVVCVLTSIAKSALQIAAGPFQRFAEQDLKHSLQRSSKVFTNCSTSWRLQAIKSHGKWTYCLQWRVELCDRMLGNAFCEGWKKGK